LPIHQGAIAFTSNLAEHHMNVRERGRHSHHVGISLSQVYHGSEPQRLIGLAGLPD